MRFDENPFTMMPVQKKKKTETVLDFALFSIGRFGMWHNGSEGVTSEPTKPCAPQGTQIGSK